MAEATQPAILSDEAMALIKQGTPKPQTSNGIISLVPPSKAEATETSPDNSVAKADKEVLPKVKPSFIAKPKVASKPEAGKESEPAVVTLVSMNCRVPSAIPTALLKASSERKLNRIRPFTQQDIVTEALTDWLEMNGYLSDRE